MRIGFIGLGNVGGKLANSLLRNKFDLTVRDLEKNLTKSFANNGAKSVDSSKELAEQVDLIITCLPSPKVCSEVMEAKDGVINGLSKNKIWLEMSTTDESEVKRIGKLVAAKKATPLDGPVSGGCHRAATGNIAIFVGGERKAFEKIKLAKPEAEVTTPSTAVIKALKKLEIKKISIFTPYSKKLNDEVVEYFKKENFNVTSNSYFDIESDFDIGKVDQNYLYEVLSKIDLNDADALFVSCTALPVLPIIDKLEKKLNKVVLSSNQALIWDTLEKIGKNDSIKGFGKLFNSN